MTASMVGVPGKSTRLTKRTSGGTTSSADEQGAYQESEGDAGGRGDSEGCDLLAFGQTCQQQRE